MNNNLINQLYKDVLEYVNANTKYNVTVVQKSLKQSNKFPLISIIEEDNSNVIVSTDFRDKTDLINISINIYAQDMVLGNTTISNVNIVKELMSLVDDVLSRKYHLMRTSCRPTPNLDNTIYRITARYTKKMLSNKNLLI